jgi:hypothetical protein
MENARFFSILFASYSSTSGIFDPEKNTEQYRESHLSSKHLALFIPILPFLRGLFVPLPG